MVTIVDPPGGWKFGFPAPLEEDYLAQLRRANYPSEWMELALTSSRYWKEKEDVQRY